MSIFLNLKAAMLLVAAPLIAITISGLFFSIPLASAQIQSGGVDKEGSWYAGEGLKQGDYFRYSMCHVDQRMC